MSKRLYYYLTKHGNRHARWFAPGEQPPQIRVGRGVAVLNELNEGHRKGRTWPMFSDAMGVHPLQIQEATEHSREIGVPTNFTADGRAIFEGPPHRKKYCEKLGYYDRNGGHGDPQKRL